MNSDQRSFFKQIAALAFVNPFSELREQLDCQLLNMPLNTLDIYQRGEKIQTLLKEQLQKLGCLETFNLANFAEKDKENVELAWLYFQFHEYQHVFFQFIENQKQAGDKPIELPFANSMGQRFLKAGFTQLESEKYIALFYQLQRGFYFINSAITGDCQSMVELRMHLWNNIFTFNPKWYLDYLCGKMEDFSTLLLGATGTGKSLAAHTIGCSGFIPFDLNKKRFKESFTRSFQFINLSQYPASLLESELFGHKKGAFTGAIDNHQGLFARCSEYGAVFIDEIGDIDMPTQVKLLNVIQDRTFSPVGSHDKIRFSGRVISATNRDIQQLRKDEKFRDDLYYRLCSDVIEVPSLQQRLQENPEELSYLIAGLVGRILDEADSKLVAEIEKKIRCSVPKNYHWPGNVRELEQCIRRICITGEYTIKELSQEKIETSRDVFSGMGEVNAQHLMQHYCRHLYAMHGSYEAVARITHLDRRTVKKYMGDF